MLRMYTSNIDNIETRDLRLAKKTVQLHDRVNETKCDICYEAGEVVRELFSKDQRPICQQCVLRGTARGSSSIYYITRGKVRRDRQYSKDTSKTTSKSRMTTADLPDKLLKTHRIANRKTAGGASQMP